jgi:DNA (cytosine-5)-methyltransferase 1
VNGLKLRHLDLFSGIGGFSLGLEATGGFETVAFCDIEEYPRKVLEKHWPRVKQYTDIKELTYDKLKSDGIISDNKKIDIITGGYPCQPFSVAGRKKGEEDPRHLWPEYFRLVQELRPDWIIGENVSGHIKLGLDTVLENLESEGYATRTFSISASSVGANHQRERIFIVANSMEHSECDGLTGPKKRGGSEETVSEESKGENNTLNVEGTSGIPTTSTNVANTNREGSQGSGMETDMEEETFHQSPRRSGQGREQEGILSDAERIGQQGQGKHVRPGSTEKDCEGETDWLVDEGEGTQGWWDIEPDVGRVAHGIPKRVDRLKCLGNSLIPHIPYYIGCSILESYYVANADGEKSLDAQETRDDGEDGEKSPNQYFGGCRTA